MADYLSTVSTSHTERPTELLVLVLMLVRSGKLTRRGQHSVRWNM